MSDRKSAPGQIKPDFGDEKSRSNIALRIKDFSLAFGDRQLFSDAELEIGCGQKVALVGPNGSGKSSLIKAVINYGQWESRHAQDRPKSENRIPFPDGGLLRRRRHHRG